MTTLESENMSIIDSVRIVRKMSKIKTLKIDVNEECVTEKNRRRDDWQTSV